MYTLTYDVTDSSGNIATTVTRTVEIVDTIAPIISLQDSNEIEVYMNSTWIDPGATCSDNYDTNCAVTSSGNVDTSTPGSYTITYNTLDSSGNVASSVTRIVEVVT